MVLWCTVAPLFSLCYHNLMDLKLFGHIAKFLKKAHYEYDSSVHEWVGWIKGYPGVYAQGRTVEDVRGDLISVLEDFILLDLQQGKKFSGFPVFSRASKKMHALNYAAAHK